MTSMYGISAYQQVKQSSLKNQKVEHKKSDATSQVATKSTTKTYAPIDTSSSLVPKTTEYGNTIGNVTLSDEAKAYYDKLKSKFNNLDFIAVSKDMKAQVQANAGAYGNVNKLVVLIDEEKLERMATDESYRKKYEGLIAMSTSKMAEAKNSLASSGASVKNFGMSVDSNGNESFFATVEKSMDAQKKRMEKQAAEKKEKKREEKKQVEKEAKEERIKKAKEEREYITFEADTLEDLYSKVQQYAYEYAARDVMTEEEKLMGSTIDFKG